MYLLYAEALNELGNGEEAIVWLDKIRLRAGLKGVKVSWLNHSNRSNKPSTTDGLREIIQQERMIEMAFEGSRIWDLRRWKLAEILQNMLPRGIVAYLFMNLKIIILAFFCMSMVACKEEFNKPTEEDAAITGKVSNVTVENTPGGAVLTYTIPSDASLLYVLAELKNKRGVTRQFKAAQFTNKINIDGLGDTDTYKVTLYAVNKSEMRSEPITVEINPLKPPFLTVFETVQIREDFGGVNVKFKNDTEAEVGVVLYATDSLGNYKQYGSFYTQSKDVNYTFRGMKDVDTKVGAFIKDRWDNTSDTLTKNLKPLNEIMMDKAKFKDITLPTDAKIYQGLSYISKHFMYDGRWSTVFSNPYNPGLSMTTDMSGAKQPLHVTFDMGVKARLSRVRISN